MISIIQTETFERWFEGLRDLASWRRIAQRIVRLQSGLLGTRPVGEGVHGFRMDAGPGYRLYFVVRGKTLIVLLCGGDKDTQLQDIEGGKCFHAICPNQGMI